jgi:hypothetical protein
LGSKPKDPAISEVEKALAEAKQKNAKTPDLSDWLDWARDYADSIDQGRGYWLVSRPKRGNIGAMSYFFLCLAKRQFFRYE